jgi:hypothetical protein
VEAWWSGHVWKGDLRDQDGWESACAVVLDLDREGHADLTPDLAARLDEAARSGGIPGNIFHRTPAGARVVFMLDAPCTDPAAFEAAAEGAAEMVAANLRELSLDGLTVDPRPHRDRARLFFTPHSIAKGVQRSNNVVVLRPEPYAAAVLALERPADPGPQLRPAATADRMVSIERARGYISKVPPAVQGEHGDDRTYCLAATLAIDFALSDEDALGLLTEWNRTCAPPWSEEALRAKILHARKYGRGTPGAKLGTGPTATTVAIPDLVDHWVTFTPEQLAAEPPRKEFIWGQRIPKGDVGVLAAKGGAGKTAIVTGLAIHRAIGESFLGRAVRQGTTVIATAEDDREDYLRKIAAWKSWLGGLDLAAVAHHVHLLDLTGIPFKLIRSDHRDYVPTENVEALIGAIAAKAPDADLIVIETVSRVGGDEGNSAMSALVCAAETVARRTGASVLLVAHVSQEAARRNIGDEHAPRGGTAIGANGRYTITLTGLADDVAEKLLPGITLSEPQQAELSVLRVPKINSAPRQDPVVLQIVPTRHGLVMREYEPPHGQDPEQRERSARAAIGEQLRAMAERMAKLGVPLTSSKLSEGLFKEIAGLTKQGINASVANAIEDGLLRPEKRVGRGGGTALLPGEKREGSV